MPSPSALPPATSSGLPLFYDEDSVLSLPPATLSGYLTLLTADAAISLPAVTDGNVVDACFGASSHGEREGGAADSIRATKELVRGLDGGGQARAVAAYVACFRGALRYREALDDAGLAKCCREGEIRRAARGELVRVFGEVEGK